MNAIEMNQTFIIAAYAVTWAVILAYFARLTVKGSRSQAEYDRAAGELRGGAR